MSKYANDPDVTVHHPDSPDGPSYTVHTRGGDVQVLKSLGWGLYHGPNLDMIQAEGGPGGHAWQINSADTAIEAARSVEWPGGGGGE